MIRSIFKDDLFAGKTYLVTGGGSGIGLRTAQELIQLGANVAICGRNQERLDAAIAQIQEEFPAAADNISSAVIDIRDEEIANREVANIVSRYGKLDGLVNNAGGQFPAPAEELSMKGWRAVIDNNLNGTFNMCLAGFKHSFKEHGGAIVNITANVDNGFPMMAHTSAARAGVENLAKTLMMEWGNCGVRINCVAPGTINSSGMDTYDPEFIESLKDQIAGIRAHRLGTVGEVAAAIVFLLSPAASFITGRTFHVDGGELVAGGTDSLFPVEDHGLMEPFLDK